MLTSSRPYISVKFGCFFYKCIKEIPNIYLFFGYSKSPQHVTFSSFFLRFFPSKLPLVQRVLPLSPLRYPPEPPRRKGVSGGVVLFALISFKIVQFFSEKLQNVANTLKNLWKKFGDHIQDLSIKKSFFLKKILSFLQDFRDIKFEFFFEKK